MIVFNAYACDPEKGSEPGLGWNWLTCVARHYPVHLITAGNGREAILLDAIQSDPVIAGKVTVSFIPWKLPGDFLSRQLLRYYQPYYYHFYRRWVDKSFYLAKRLCDENKVRLVHQNTYHSFREPGEFWRLPVPSIWAPVAGTANIPWSLLPSLGMVEGGRHAARNLINNGHKRWNQRFRRAVKGYSKVVAGSDEAASFLGKFRGDGVPVIPGQLIQEAPNPDTEKQIKSSGQPLRLVFCGLHLSRKGGGYLIDAISRVSTSCQVHLDMIGEGLMTQQWQKQAERLNCNQHITWHGRVERSQVLRIMREADVFVFPSISDCYPAVIAEAMSCALPVITTDVPGVGDMIDHRSGVKVPAQNEKSIVSGLVDAMQRLANNPNNLDELRAGVLERAELFKFEDRMHTLLEIYDRLLSEGNQ